MDTLSPVQAVLIFVCIPGAFVLLVALLILGPSWTRAGRYRPGESWDYEPVVINGSVGDDVMTAVTATPLAELGSAEVADLEARAKVGGASVRW